MPVSTKPVEDDVDVASERQRVLRGDADNDMVKIENLTKVGPGAREKGWVGQAPVGAGPRWRRVSWWGRAKVGVEPRWGRVSGQGRGPGGGAARGGPTRLVPC